MGNFIYGEKNTKFRKKGGQMGSQKPVPSFRAQNIVLDRGSGAYLGLLVAANENFEFFLPTMKFP